MGIHTFDLCIPLILFPPHNSIVLCIIFTVRMCLCLSVCVCVCYSRWMRYNQQIDIAVSTQYPCMPPSDECRFFTPRASFLHFQNYEQLKCVLSGTIYAPLECVFVWKAFHFILCVRHSFYFVVFSFVRMILPLRLVLVRGSSNTIAPHTINIQFMRDELRNKIEINSYVLSGHTHLENLNVSKRLPFRWIFSLAGNPRTDPLATGEPNLLFSLKCIRSMPARRPTLIYILHSNRAECNRFSHIFCFDRIGNAKG